jgi:phosphoribosylanthranilate isomerase
MVDGIRLKVCGITTRADAEMATALGADFLGFNLYPKSPRYVTTATYRGIVRDLSGARNVAVCVEPTLDELAVMNSAGFNFFQLHFRTEVPAETIAGWAAAVGHERLWLAPKLPPGIDLSAALLPTAETFLLDTFDAEKFGGTGRTGDWEKFARHQRTHPEKTWILSGGLAPDNVTAALHSTGARFIDVNSGVESAPGVKDRVKLTALAYAVRSATGPRR